MSETHEPVAWKLVENCSGKIIRRSKNRVLVAGWRRIIGATVVPVFPKAGLPERHAGRPAGTDGGAM